MFACKPTGVSLKELSNIDAMPIEVGIPSSCQPAISLARKDPACRMAHLIITFRI
jgi:hypothetical protein